MFMRNDEGDGCSTTSSAMHKKTPVIVSTDYLLNEGEANAGVMWFKTQVPNGN